MNNLYGHLADDFLDDTLTYKFDLINNDGQAVNSSPVEISGSGQEFDVSAGSGDKDILTWQGDEITIINDSGDSQACSNIACYVEVNSTDYLLGYFQFNEGKRVEEDEGVEVPTGATVEAKIKPILDFIAVPGTAKITIINDYDGDEDYEDGITVYVMPDGETDSENAQSSKTINDEAGDKIERDEEVIVEQQVPAGDYFIRVRSFLNGQITEDSNVFEITEAETKDFGNMGLNKDNGDWIWVYGVPQ